MRTSWSCKLNSIVCCLSLSLSPPSISFQSIYQHHLPYICKKNVHLFYCEFSTSPKMQSVLYMKFILNWLWRVMASNIWKNKCFSFDLIQFGNETGVGFYLRKTLYFVFIFLYCFDFAFFCRRLRRLPLFSFVTSFVLLRMDMEILLTKKTKEEKTTPTRRKSSSILYTALNCLKRGKTIKIKIKKK